MRSDGEEKKRGDRDAGEVELSPGSSYATVNSWMSSKY